MSAVHASRETAAGASTVAPTAEAASTWPRSPTSPSLTSTAALAMPRSACPRATRGCGSSMRSRAAANASAGSERLPRKTSSAARASPKLPLAHRSSPARAPERSKAWPCGTSPNTAIEMTSGPRVVSPPTSSHSCASASSSKPREKAESQASSTPGMDKDKVKASGCAPQAARSLRFTASDLWPRRAGSTVDRKWRPSTSMSVETASCMPARGASSAQSSPLPSGLRCAGRRK